MNDSVAIVTGASQGIGRSTAIRLARDFSHVVRVARNGNALEEVASEVRQGRAEPLVIALDLSQVSSPETVVKTTLDRCGRISALSHFEPDSSSRARFMSRTLTLGSPKKPNWRSWICDCTMERTLASERCRAAATRETC